MIDRFNPIDMAPPFTRYSQGVEIPANARTVIVGGQVGVRPDGSMSDDMAEQTEQAFRNIETVLRSKGMELYDLVQTRTYIVNRQDLLGYRKGRAAAFAACDPIPEPAVALLIVSGLAQSHWKIEICAIGAKIDSGTGT